MSRRFFRCGLRLCVALLASAVLVPPSSAESFNLAPAVVVTNGVPATGAGVLDVAQEQDVFAFSAAAGQKLFFRDLGADPNIDWELFDSGNQQIFRDRLDGYAPSRITIPSSGRYELRVLSAGDGTATGNYSFEIIEAPDEVMPLTIRTGAGGSRAKE